MDERWLEVEKAGGKEKVALGEGLTRIGGNTADVVLFDGVAGELHLWDDPPKLVNIGADSSIRVNGGEFEEHALDDGDLIEWGDSRLFYRVKAKPPVLEEIELEAPKAAAVSAPGAGARGDGESRVARRVRAGLLAELGLADKKAVSRWQQAVIRQEFDVEACTREILSSATVAPDDSRLLERSARLTRDLLMAPMQRGVKSAGRKARGAAKNSAAFMVAQLIIIGIVLVLLLLFMVFVHVKWPDFSFDDFLGYLVPWEE